MRILTFANDFSDSNVIAYKFRDLLERSFPEIRDITVSLPMGNYAKVSSNRLDFEMYIYNLTYISNLTGTRWDVFFESEWDYLDKARYNDVKSRSEYTVDSVYALIDLIREEYYKNPIKFPDIEKVIFNDPATIVKWSDGTKTVVKCEHVEWVERMGIGSFEVIREDYDPEKGLAMAISKKLFGNTGNYYERFKKYLKEEK